MDKLYTMQYMRLILITLLSTLFLMSVSVTAQNLQWFANDHFELTDAPDDALLVTYQKKSWEAFTLYVGEADFSENTILTFAVQSAVPATLRIDLMDREGNQASGNIANIKLEGGENFVEVVYDFGQLTQEIDLSKISHFHFYVNPGTPATGELLIKNIKLPKTKTASDAVSILVYPNPVTDFLKIRTTDQLFDEIILFDIQGREIARNQTTATHYHQWLLKNLPKGIYQYQLNYQTEMITSDRLLIE